MFKKFWRYFYRLVLVLLGLGMLVGAANISPSQFSAAKNGINNVMQPFLYPQSQPKNLEDNYKSCPPTQQDTDACQVYIICGDDDPDCINKAKKKNKSNP